MARVPYGQMVRQHAHNPFTRGPILIRRHTRDAARPGGDPGSVGMGRAFGPRSGPGQSARAGPPPNMDPPPPSFPPSPRLMGSSIVIPCSWCVCGCGCVRERGRGSERVTESEEGRVGDGEGKRVRERERVRK